MNRYFLVVYNFTNGSGNVLHITEGSYVNNHKFKAQMQVEEDKPVMIVNIIELNSSDAAGYLDITEAELLTNPSSIP